MSVYPPTILTQVSLGSLTNIWGVDASNTIYQYNGSVWTRIAGALKQVSAAPDGTVWGVAIDNTVYRYDGNQRWTQMPGILKQVSVGSSGHIWGVSPSNQSFIYDGGTWVKVGDGAIKEVCADRKQGPPMAAQAWGLTPQGELYRSFYYNRNGSWALVSTSSPHPVTMSITNGDLLYVTDEAGVSYHWVPGGTGFFRQNKPLARSVAYASESSTYVLIDLQGTTQQSPQSAGWNTPVEEPAQNDPTFPFRNNAILALKADNDLYLSPINRGTGMNPVEAAKSSIDAYAQFTVTLLPSNQIALKAANGLYLGLINRGAGIDPIEALKGNIDVYAQFTVTLLSSNQIALQAANGLYLSRIGRDGGKMPIEAAKSSMDGYCQFTFVLLN